MIEKATVFERGGGYYPMKWRIVQVCILAVVCILVVCAGASAGNRFNVFVYQDGGDYVNQDAFYDSIRVFGASHFYTYHPELIPDC